MLSSTTAWYEPSKFRVVYQWFLYVYTKTIRIMTYHKYHLFAVVNCFVYLWKRMFSQKSEGYICCCCFRESTNPSSTGPPGHLRRWLLRWYWAFGHSVGESLWQRPLPGGLCRWRSSRPTSFWGKTSGPRPRFKMLEEKSKHVSRLKTLQIQRINKHINKKIWHSTSRCYFYQMLTDYVLPLCHGNIWFSFGG